LISADSLLFQLNKLILYDLYLNTLTRARILQIRWIFF